MRKVSNSRVIELAERGLAEYKNGDEIAPIGSFSEATKAINLLTEQVANSSSVDSDAILAACTAISESMALHHEAVALMLKASSTPTDQGKLDAIDVKMQAILSEATKKRTWNFEIERDLVGEMTNVVAKEISNV